MRFLSERGQQDIRGAVEAIEATSSVEVVVAVRQRLARWPSAHVAIGMVAALAMLAFTLYSDQLEFAYWEIVLFPLLAGMVFGLLVELLPAVQRALTAPRIRERQLREASRATFYELGVHKTRERTGLLVFVAVLDRRVALVGDVGVVEALGQRTLDAHAKTLAAEIPHGLVAVAAKLRELAPTFEKPLPRRDDDIDELANAVHAVGRRKPRARGVVR